MSDVLPVNDDVFIGPQPSEAEFQQLARDGVQTVINLRPAGEEDQPLSPGAEARVVYDLDMTYEHLPVSGSTLTDELVDQFREMLIRCPRPIFVHCRKGQRAAAFVMMHEGVEHGMSAEETLQTADDLGLPLDSEKMRAFVGNYVNTHGSTVHTRPGKTVPGTLEKE